MYQTSELLNEVLFGDSRTFKAKLKYGDQEYTDGFRSVQLYSMSSNNNNISVGGAYSAYVNITMWKPEFSLEGKEVKLSLGVLSGDDVEWVDIGLFTIEKPKNNDGLITFAAYDRIQSKMGGAYFSELTYPTDAKNALIEISQMTGVDVDVSNLPDGVMLYRRESITESTVDQDGNATTQTTYDNPFSGYTYREALGYIAMLYCKYAISDRHGKIVFKWYGDVDYTVNPSRYFDDLVTTELVFSVGAISCSVGDEILTSGSGVENLKLENPVMTQERLDYIHQEVSKLQFLPASVSFLGDMRVEVGDVITINDKRGNVVKLPVMNIIHDFDGGLLTKVNSYGGVSESIVEKGYLTQRLERTYTELFLVKELIGTKASFDYVFGRFGEFDTVITEELQAVVASIEELRTNSITTENLEAHIANLDLLTAESADIAYAKIDLANVEASTMGTLLARIGILEDVTIDEGYVTGVLNGVRINADVITTGTLSVDRLLITGEDSIVYQINAQSSGLSASELEDEVYKSHLAGSDIVAGSITGDRIAAGTITADKIDVFDLFADNIMATGTITGATLYGAKLYSEEGELGGWKIADKCIYSETESFSSNIPKYTAVLQNLLPGITTPDKVTGTGFTSVVHGSDIRITPDNDGYIRFVVEIPLSESGNYVISVYSEYGAAGNTDHDITCDYYYYVAPENPDGFEQEVWASIGSIKESVLYPSNTETYSYDIELPSDAISFGSMYLECYIGSAVAGKTYNFKFTLLKDGVEVPTESSPVYGVPSNVVLGIKQEVNGIVSGLPFYVTKEGLVQANSIAATEIFESGVKLSEKYLALTGGELIGLLSITANGNTVQIGSQNEGFCHFTNSADIPFYFNKAVHAVDGFTVYNSATSLENGALRIGSNVYGHGYIELCSATPFIDFRYGNSASDYTSRIIATASGILNITGKLTVADTVEATNGFKGMLLEKGFNTITSTANDTTANWSKHCLSMHYYSVAGQLIDQPSTYGFLLNLGRGSDVHQIWLTQSSGNMAHRSGNQSGWGATWRVLLDSGNYKDYPCPYIVSSTAEKYCLSMLNQNVIPGKRDSSNAFVSNTGKTSLGTTTNYFASLLYSGSLSKQSDRRSKNPLGQLSIDETLTLMRGLSIEKFTYLNDDNQVVNYGVYAQEFRDLLIRSGIGHVAALTVGVVETDEVITDIFYDEELVRYSVDYTQFVPLTIKGWQYHDERIRDLEYEVLKLKNEIMQLRASI